jgi:hypothetical protein
MASYTPRKEIHKKHHIGTYSYYLLENVNIKGEDDKKKVGSSLVIDTDGSNFGDFRIDFLGENEAIPYAKRLQPVNQG